MAHYWAHLDARFIIEQIGDVASFVSSTPEDLSCHLYDTIMRAKTGKPVKR
jgi:hypothetical protein